MFVGCLENATSRQRSSMDAAELEQRNRRLVIRLREALARSYVLLDSSKHAIMQARAQSLRAMILTGKAHPAYLERSSGSSDQIVDRNR